MVRRFVIKPKPLAIRLFRARGCANRPFYHIIVARPEDRCIFPGIEQLGVYDPMPNEHGEKIISLNIERFKYYMANGAWLRSTVAILLGATGIVPIHPHAYTLGWKNRRLQLELEAEQQSTEKVESSSNE